METMKYKNMKCSNSVSEEKTIEIENIVDNQEM